MKELKIIKAKPKYAEEISDVLKKSFIEFESKYTTKAFKDTTPNREKVLERLKEGPIWIVLLNEKIVGTVSVVPRKNGLYIRGMAVIPESRGLQIGWKLLEHINRYAVKNSFNRIFLSTTPFLKRAIRLYENFGFIKSIEGPYDLYGTPIFTMHKYIKPD